MKDGAAEIIGKTITGVIVKSAKDGKGHPKGQLFLVFDDGSSFEFYNDYGPFSAAGSLDKNISFREIYNYMEDRYDIDFQAIKDPDSDDIAFNND